MAPAVVLAVRRRGRSLPLNVPDLPDGSVHLGGAADGPLAAATRLETRAETASATADPSHGVLDPHDISNIGFFVLFALIGLAFVITGIWFFFWAKNGGFYFKKSDWEDYKSTVLRRKGPNGTLLSGATPSTKLGGGSVYRDVVAADDDDDGRTVTTESTAMTGITAGASDIAAREQRRKAKRARKSRGSEQSTGRRPAGGDDDDDGAGKRRAAGPGGVTDEGAETAAKKELRNYRSEKPARVGGLNKESEGSSWDGSTQPSESTASSDLLAHQQSTPRSTPTKTSGGIRKVYSTADRNDNAERVRAEARRLREEGRTARRDFAYQRAAEREASSSKEGLLPDGKREEGEEVGTKSYHHPMPELRERNRERERAKDRAAKVREERRAKRGGYRRGRGEEQEDE